MHATKDRRSTRGSDARLGARGAILAALFLSVASRRADAYTISNELTDGCHERITSAALRAVRQELKTAAPLPISSNDRALVDDLQFTPDDDMRDLGGATLLAAVRDNDLKGRASDDLSALAEVHGDPNGQFEHCLRRADDKEPGGSSAALDACRTFIREQALASLSGLDDKGMPDPSKRTSLAIHLSIRGKVHAPLPTYYVAVGQAIHAIEDSFTHTYRTADGKKITVVLNWLDQAHGTLHEERDGPGHAKALDRCDDPDPLRTARRVLATEAAAAFLRATLDPTKTNEQKMTNVEAVLDTYLGYSPGCTIDNDWCNAAENQYKDPKGCGCFVGNVSGSGGAMFGAAVVLLAAVRRSARRRRARGLAALGVVGALSLGGGTARAAEPETTTRTTVTPAQDATPTAPAKPAKTTQTTTTPSDKPGSAPTTATVVTTPTTTTTTVTTPTKEGERSVPAPTVVPVAEPGPANPSSAAFGGYAGVAGSLDKPAMAGALGARLRISKGWAFGLDGEWNPWFSFNGTTVRKGAVNVYGTAMLRFPLAYENFNLRVSASLGVSYQLTDLYGAPSGSVGPYFGVSPLAVEWKLSRIFYLIINPINVALPVPHVTDVPFLYPQYRTTIGIEVYGG